MNQDSIVYLNGVFQPLSEAKISVLDRGFIFGDGVYEVVPVYQRRPFRMAQHLKRLENSLAAIRLPNPKSAAEWEALFLEMIQKAPHEQQAVYLQITRGVAPRDHGFPKGVTPTVFMMSVPLKTPTPEHIERGVACVSAEDFRWHRCDIKSISLLGNVLSRQMSVDAGAMETILFRDGFLTEASASNVLVVKNGVILAPPQDHLILPGVSLNAVLEFAPMIGIPVEIRPISRAEVLDADELWLTSSGKEVLAVTTLDGKPVGNGKPGSVFKKMWAYYQSEIRNQKSEIRNP
ncbi:MAG: D-amino acid aminotransferase [Proteobacteria bacterium]|nr:D-amino acid aminotransferase [Pseudomonadota bacterium]MCL2306809.1 D-amino acid aminotransferase [Pseudomonadota bacterium]